MVREIRFAFRRLARSPGFVVIAVVTLALAIGASTAVLSLVNALLIRPLPYRAPQQLDPVAFTVAPLVLAIAALIATWLAARRATQVDPIRALRTE
jgi:ABC-type antimicrobial peptide transport system permease subunit